ncbi:MAG: hypothetical protein KatS3mg100_252 [Candidatus Parcubacteria bacterium]|nr:MAG: hypothetical protein KatS3mg100_252 [Candidatus Parcubacteria bacterium]
MTTSPLPQTQSRSGRIRFHFFGQRWGKRLGKAGLVALVCLIATLWGFWGWSVVREREDPHRSAPPSGAFVESDDGVMVFYQTRAEPTNPAVLLLHGTEVWSASWGLLLDDLAEEGLFVVAPDLPPFGFSTKLKDPHSYTPEAQVRRIYALLTHLGVRRVHLVAHSAGAPVALAFARAYPQQAQSLTLIAPAIGLLPNDPFVVDETARTSSPFLRVVFGWDQLRDVLVAAVGTNPWLTRLLFARLVADPASITEKDIALVQRQFTLAQFTPAFASWLEQLLLLQTPADNALLDYLDATGIPILFVWGTKDPLTPFAQALWLRERLSRATLVTIPDVGHIPQLEAYAQVRDAVAQFVRKQAS